jgi:hypothetical protein
VPERLDYRHEEADRRIGAHEFGARVRPIGRIDR